MKGIGQTKNTYVSLHTITIQNAPSGKSRTIMALKRMIYDWKYDYPQGKNIYNNAFNLIKNILISLTYIL